MCSVNEIFISRDTEYYVPIGIPICIRKYLIVSVKQEIHKDIFEGCELYKLEGNRDVRSRLRSLCFHNNTSMKTYFTFLRDHVFASFVRFDISFVFVL